MGELTKLREWCRTQVVQAEQQKKRRTADPGKPWDQPRLDWTGRYIAYSHVLRTIDDRIFELGTGIEMDDDFRKAANKIDELLRDTDPATE